MGYGFSFNEMKKIFKPVPKQKTWGYILEISKRKEYCLEQFLIKKNKIQPMNYYSKKEGTLFVEQGNIILRTENIKGKKIALKMFSGNTFHIPAKTPHSILGITESIVYFFSNGFQAKDLHYTETTKKAENDLKNFLELAEKNKIRPKNTTDFRKKYWGSIETIVDKDYCGKKIVMEKNTQNSLEVHCKKHETYFVHSGKVKIGLRLGRAENKSILLKKGEVFNIPPGLIHMKIAPQKCTIIEISTKDDDSDSHLVEDGIKYVHKEK